MRRVGRDVISAPAPPAWSDLVTQARPAPHRPAQPLDEAIHEVRMRKIEVLGPLMPERDARVSVHFFAGPAETPSRTEIRSLGAANARTILLGIEGRSGPSGYETYPGCLTRYPG